MNPKTSLLVLFATGLMLLFQSQLLAQGNLMIVGGGLESDNKEVFEEIIRLSGGSDKAVISVIPAASGVAAQTFEYFKLSLLRHGMKAENIHLIPIALVDDDSTTDVNEATWAANATNLELAEKVRNSNCIWFSGGDQLRIIQSLIMPDGSPSPVLEAVWEVYNAGGLIGGTSAGAAIMSDPMIGSGTSMGALRYGAQVSNRGEDNPDAKGVLLTQGLGFFSPGIVDQHFHARARIGRLITAMNYTQQSLAFGIDENTALVYYGREFMLKVAGAAGVTVLDATNARFGKAAGFDTTKGLLVHYLQSGDAYLMIGRLVVPAADKNILNERASDGEESNFSGGVFASEEDNFPVLLTEKLMRNKNIENVKSLNFFDDSHAFLLTLSKQPESKAFFKRNEDRSISYTVVGVRLDIAPVALVIQPMK
jgi:cyanophycinase